ncbi:MAG: ATP-binding protein [Treponemataceae bacterium]
METELTFRLFQIALYGFSAFAALWVAAFAFYGLRRARGLPFSYLSGMVVLWNLSNFFQTALNPALTPENSFLVRLFFNGSHISYSLLLPLLYVFSRGDGFRGIRRERKFVLLGIPIAANLFLWLFPPTPFGPHQVNRVVFVVQAVYSVLLVVLCAVTLYRRSRDPSDYERTSIARVLVAAVVFSVVFGLYRAGIFRGPSFDPSPIAVTIAVIIVAAGYRRLDPFTAAAENENRLKRYEFMADASREYMSIINRDFRYEAVNAAFCASMKRTREEVIGRGVEDLWGSTIFKEYIEKPLCDCLSGTTLVFRSNFAFGDGQPRSQEVSYYPFIPQGSSLPTHAVVVTKDITDYARKEEELEAARRQADAANTAKSDFLAAMSHEIRTPINAVMGLTELSLKKEIDPELRDDLETVKAASINLLALVNDILDLSKIEAGGMRLESIPFSPRESIIRTIKSFKPAVDRKGIVLEKSLDERVPDLVIGDPLRFSQVLFNLIGNAVKFTERGGVYVSLLPIPRKESQEKIGLRIEVRDTGIGISADRLEAIFESFSQATEGTSRKYGGSGLGLTISRRLARLLGGDVSAESVGGSGSTFTFHAYFSIAPAGSVSENVIAVAVPHQSKYPKTDIAAVMSSPPGSILLVEDNPINARVAMRFLQSFGKSADHARDGAEALGFLRSKRYGLVFMDVELPELDGLELTRRIRQGEAGESSRVVPIVAMTAYSGPEARSKCAEAGMDDFLTKPLDFPALESILSRFDLSFPYPVSQPVVVDEPSPPVPGAGIVLPVLDRKNTLVRLGGDEELINELYGILRSQAAERTSQALRYVEENDYVALAGLAHQVKGSAASLGALRLAAAANTLQKAAEAKNGDLISLALSAFLEAFALTYKEVEP